MSSQFQTNIVEAFFLNSGETSGAGIDRLNHYALIGVALNVLILFYKPLSDRFGRKPFLVLNTFFMGLGLFVIYLANSLWIYVIGSVLVGFFVSEDIQVVYLLETAPKKHRGMILSFSKGFAVLGTMIVPLLRKTVMANDDARWRYVYLGAAIVGFLVSFIALLTSRESPVFLESRMAYLRLSDEGRAELKASKEKEKASQGGFFEGLRFAFTHKQLRSLLIASFFMLFPLRAPALTKAS